MLTYPSRLSFHLKISSLDNRCDNEMPSNGPLILFSHCRLLLPGVRLSPDIVFITPDDSFTAERRTCHLLGKARLLCPEVGIYSCVSEKGVVGIFGPRSAVTSEHIRSIADNMDIPFIETRPNFNLGKGRLRFNYDHIDLF